MEHKSYKLEIVCLLLREPSHVRGLAKKLGTNHMIASRKLKELMQENAVDFRQEGRNKTYFIKKTAEARAYAFMAEQYKLLQVLQKYPSLRGIIEKIQKDKRIHLALLFGSYAKDLARRESDVDIYVETEDASIKRELSLFDSKASVKIGGYVAESNMIKEIERDHVVIKGVDEFYEKNRLFG